MLVVIYILKYKAIYWTFPKPSATWQICFGKSDRPQKSTKRIMSSWNVDIDVLQTIMRQYIIFYSENKKLRCGAVV